MKTLGILYLFITAVIAFSLNDKYWPWWLTIPTAAVITAIGFYVLVLPVTIVVTIYNAMFGEERDRTKDK